MGRGEQKVAEAGTMRRRRSRSGASALLGPSGEYDYVSQPPLLDVLEEGTQSRI